ncbi:MAG: hypothetical protein M1837_001004 [Sclerophora amabilis]|nr:MAG: hypothetical protein M1837_001004 [Sclerophora amabilis]
MRTENAPGEESRDDLPSMQELEPSPIEDSPAIEKGGYFPVDSISPPSATPSARSSTLGLSGGGGHGVAYYLIRLQRYSSYASSLFLIGHVTNTALIPLATRSVSASDNYLLLTRPYYQSPLAEPLVVVLPILTHVVSGLGLRLYRRYQLRKRYDASLYSRAERRKLSAWPKVSATSALGSALVPLVATHVLVNRLVPLWVEGGSSSVGLGYVAHGFAKHPVVAAVGYATLIGVGSWHFVNGWAKWLGWAPDQVPEGSVVGGERKRRRRWWGVNGISAFVAAIWMAGGLGIVGRGGVGKGWVGRGWDELYRQVPIVGEWM